MNKAVIGSWPEDYKWYEYCLECKSVVFVGMAGVLGGVCSVCESSISGLCSKDVLSEKGLKLVTK